MNSRISSNAKDILRKMRARKAAVERELAGAARQLGPELSADAKRIQQLRIYNVPIPLKASSERKLGANSPIRKRTTKGQHGKWQRSGNLKRSEGWRTEGVTLYLTNNTEYAAARDALGTARGRKIKSPGVQSVQWQVEAITRKRARILEVRRRALLRALLRA